MLYTAFYMEIKLYEKNAKEHPDKQLKLLAKIVKEVGWRQNVEVNQQGVIIAGHGRYLTWEKYKDEYNLPEVWVTDDTGKTIMGKHADFPLTEEQEKMWRLADNQINAMTGVDMDLVIPELKDMSKEMQELTGFDSDLIIEPEEKDDEVPEIPEEPQSKLGDLYELGNHRVLCGDSTKIEDVERLMDGKKADMVFTDPPYGMGFDIKNDGIDEFETIFTDTVVHWIKNTKKENWYICGNFRCLSFFESVLKAHDIELYEKIVWVKNLYGQGKLYNRMHEDILFAGSGSFYKVDKDVDVWQEDSVRNFGGSKNANEAVGHPTQKPVNLVARAIKNSSKNEDIVLDSFLGSGSTLIAAEKTGRICYGMELDPKYIDVIVQRYVDYTGISKIKKNGKDIVWKKK